MRYIVVLLIVCISSGISLGQSRVPENIPKFDSRRIHFGFLLGYNSADCYVDRTVDADFSDSLLSLQTKKQPGFNINIVSSLKIADNFKMRFLPGLSFQDRVLHYNFATNDTTQFYEKRIQSTFLDFPVNFKVRTDRVTNFAAYFLFGGKYSIDMQSQSKTKQSRDPDEQLVKIGRYDYSAEIGGGFDFFLPYFKFGIELKLSYGMKNLIIHDGTIFDNPVESFRTKLWLLSFTFEG